MAVYGVLAFCLTPLFVVPLYTGQKPIWRLLPGHVGNASYRIPSADYAMRSFRSLVDPTVGATRNFSLRGTQTLPWTALPFVLVGSVGSPFGLAGLAGLAPDIFSSHEAASSGRQMFAFLPFVFAASRAYAPLIAGVFVAAEGVVRWVRLCGEEPWVLWAWPDGYRGLDPCRNVEPTPAWCESRRAEEGSTADGKGVGDGGNVPPDTTRDGPGRPPRPAVGAAQAPR
ncbi:MAG: hypothetical protein KatS3mg076_0782 [Candidatus Binatia bacterium]|nr:MAG: hypothetical protein KatS3mg076_0782 [Candidatus Binatia bacterium]